MSTSEMSRRMGGGERKVQPRSGVELETQMRSGGGGVWGGAADGA